MTQPEIDKIQHDTLNNVDDVALLLEEYRANAYDLFRLREIRADLSVLNVMLGDNAGHLYQIMSDAEYHRKSEEAKLYVQNRKTMGAGDAERQSLIDAKAFYDNENEWKGMYKRIDNQCRAILKVLDSMASKLRDNGDSIGGQSEVSGADG